MVMFPKREIMHGLISGVMLVAGSLALSANVFGQDAAVLAGPEQQAMSDTVQYALEKNKSNQASDWVNPDSGNSGGVTPLRTFANDQGQPCREFLSTIIIGGEQQQGYGTACRQADGSWQIVPDDSSVHQGPPPQLKTNVYVDSPPPAYYYYPPDFYYPFHIYLSFGTVYRGGYFYRGHHYLDGPAFRQRYPFRVRNRVFIGPQDPVRYHTYRGWWHYQPREGARVHHDYGRRSTPHVWRDRDQGNKRWHPGRR